MINKVSVAAIGALALASGAVSAETITSDQILNNRTNGNTSSTVGNVTFTANPGEQISQKDFRGGSAAGVDNATGDSRGGAEIGKGESLTLNFSPDTASMLFSGTTLEFLYSRDSGTVDSVNEVAVITAFFDGGGSSTVKVKRLARNDGQTVKLFYNGSSTASNSGAVEYAESDSDSGNGQGSLGLVKLGRLFGDQNITSLVYSGAGRNCEGTCYQYPDYAISDVTLDVPEPGTVLLMGFGMVLLGYGLRRRRRDNLG